MVLNIFLFFICFAILAGGGWIAFSECVQAFMDNRRGRGIALIALFLSLIGGAVWLIFQIGQ